MTGFVEFATAHQSWNLYIRNVCSVGLLFALKLTGRDPPSASLSWLDHRPEGGCDCHPYFTDEGTETRKLNNSQTWVLSCAWAVSKAQGAQPHHSCLLEKCSVPRASVKLEDPLLLLGLVPTAWEEASMCY